ncbi:MAG: hypothetical protein Kow001_14190 [Acidobacteriota bacterium]
MTGLTEITHRQAQDQGMYSPRGFSLLSILVVVALVGLGYVVLIGLPGGTGDNPHAVSSSQLVQSRGLSLVAACRTNRRAAAKALTTWAVTHPDRPATLEDLRNRGLLVQECPEGGKFELVDGKVVCRRHRDG